MPGRQHDAPLLVRAHAGGSAAVASAGAVAHLHEHQCAVGLAHDQIDFPTPAPRRPIIALNQPQAGLLQMAQRRVFGGIAGLLAGSAGKHH